MEVSLVKPTESQRDALEKSPFETVETTSDVSISRHDRYARLFDEFVKAPARIVWSDWRARVGASILLLYILMGTVGTLVIEPPNPNSGKRLLMPFQTWKFPLGTDALGQGIFAQIVHATPAMLKMITAGAIFSTAVATVVGTLSGYKGGWLDSLLMGVADVMMTIPGLPLIIVVAAIIEPRNPFVVGILLTINGWAGLARSLRSQVLTLRDDAYVEASRTMNVSTWKILSKDIIPNLMPFVAVNFVGTARAVIFSSVGLYFLGILPFSNLNWGVMMNLAYKTAGSLYTWKTAHWLLLPMFTIVLLSFGLILLAQGTDQIFNPRVRARHADSHEDEDEVTDVGSSNTQVMHK